VSDYEEIMQLLEELGRRLKGRNRAKHKTNAKQKNP